MEYKAVQSEVSYSAKKQYGYIKGYASIFNVRDQQGDVILPGAFKRSIKKPERVKLLWQHDPKSPIGVWINMVEDDQGLLVEGQIPLGVQKGMEAYLLLDNGALKGLSIGYNILDSYVEGGTRYIKEVDLVEVSIVTFPANNMAVVHNVKGYLDQVGSIYDEAVKALSSLRSMISSFYSGNKDDEQR